MFDPMPIFGNICGAIKFEMVLNFGTLCQHSKEEVGIEKIILPKIINAIIFEKFQIFEPRNISIKYYFKVRLTQAQVIFFLCPSNHTIRETQNLI